MMDRRDVCDHTTKIKQKYCLRPMFSSSTFTVNICSSSAVSVTEAIHSSPSLLVMCEKKRREGAFVLNLDVIRKQVEDKRLRHERLTGFVGEGVGVITLQVGKVTSSRDDEGKGIVLAFCLWIFE